MFVYRYVFATAVIAARARSRVISTSHVIESTKVTAVDELKKQALDLQSRRHLRSLEKKLEVLQEFVGHPAPTLRRYFARRLDLVEETIKLLETTRTRGIGKQIFSQATIAAIDRNLHILYHLRECIREYRGEWHPALVSAFERVDTVKVKVMPRFVKIYIAYLVVVAALGVYLGIPTVTRGELAPIPVTALIVSALSVLTLVRVVLYPDHWKVER